MKMEQIMAVSLDSILGEAMKLPPVEKTSLIEKLLSGFEFSGRAETDRLWAEEAESRLDAYNKGKLKARPVQEVINEINQHK